MIARALALAFFLAAFTAGAQAPLRAFDHTTPASLRKEHAGRPYVLAFWSIHCEPCVREMPMWREMAARRPGVPVVLVSTDPPAGRERVAAFLARHDPGDVQRWQYADDFEERIRHAVDPKWRGELPRTFFDASHAVTARTGLPEKDEVERWFARVDPGLRGR